MEQYDGKTSEPSFGTIWSLIKLEKHFTMKNLLLIALFASSFLVAQMPNISEVWLNKSKPYIGTIGNATKDELKFKVNISELNKKDDQEYFLAGNSVVDKTITKFEGKLTISKYKDGKKRSSVYGDYQFAEEPTGKHSGIFKGKFVYTFIWNKKTQKIDQQYIAFVGDWKSYDGKLTYKTMWKN